MPLNLLRVGLQQCSVKEDRKWRNITVVYRAVSAGTRSKPLHDAAKQVVGGIDAEHGTVIIQIGELDDQKCAADMIFSRIRLSV